MARTGAAGTTIELNVKFYANGNPFDPFYVGPVQIYDAASGGNSVATIVPSRSSVGVWDVNFNAPRTLTPGTYWEQIIWTAENDLPSNTQRYPFTVSVAGAQQIGGVPQEVGIAVAIRVRPTWAYEVGLDQTQDVGNGMGMILTWGPAKAALATDQVYYNIYAADKRLNTFGYPVAITLQEGATINVPPGNMYYFAVRATEFNPNYYDPTQLEQMGAGVYQYPASQTLEADIDAYGATLQVQDASEFPSAGFVLIDYEVLYYTSKTASSLTVLEEDRGAYSTPVLSHLTGATVKLFKGIEDNNSVIVAGTAAWSKANGPPRNVAAEGQFNVDADGYRTNAVDIVTTNLTVSDASTIDFPDYDYASYHRPSMQSYFQGGCQNSYAWGELNGERGVGLQDQELSRLDMLLQTTGEPVVLLKRKQTGMRCRCTDLRHENPTARCQYCYGTGFEGGYDRYMNPRAISEAYTNAEGMIMVRVAPFEDDFKWSQNNGLMQAVELPAWTINVPTLKEFDSVIRMNQDGTEEFRYAVVKITRNRLMFGLSGRQDFRLKRLDQTDILYSFKWQI